MTAQTNHTIDTSLSNGYGRCGAVPVWISAVHDERRVVYFLLPTMDEQRVTYRKPWNVTKADAGNWAIQEDPKELDKGDFRIVADLVPDASEEDARLMAAAPELLEVCKTAAEDCRMALSGEWDIGNIEHPSEGFQVTLEMLEKNIANAEGK